MIFMPLKWWSMMKSNVIICLLGGLLVLTSCGCSKKRVLPDVPVPDPSEHFQRYVKDQELSSKILHEYIKYSVFLPEDYATNTEARYPVVYMLHGLGDDQNSWNGNYLHANQKIQALEAEGMGKMIYVFPQGYASYYCNFYNGSYNYMDMFVEELIPLIDKQYRTIPDKQHRAITGYSMGGFGACALAEKHPELFNACATLSMSVRTDWQYMEESQRGWDNQWGIIFGGVGSAGSARITDYYKQHCPLHYFNAANKAALSTVHWYLICGDNEENLLYANDELHCILRDNGYAHQYRVVDGGHSSSVWMPALSEVLPMFDYYMNGGSLWSPTPEKAELPSPLPVEENGCWVSPKFQEKGSGTAVLVAFDQQFQASGLPTLYAALQLYPSKDKGYVLLPCDLSQKTLADWMAYWDQEYTFNDHQIFGIGTAASQALQFPAGTFSRHYFIDPDVNNTAHVVLGEQIYFAGTDLSTSYHGMNTLYNLCKKNEAEFEYRIVRGCGEPLPDLLSSLQTISTQFYY